MRFFIRAVVILALCLPLGGCIEFVQLLGCLAGFPQACADFYFGPGLKMQYTKGLVEGSARLTADLTSSPCQNMGGGRQVCDFSRIFDGVTSDYTIDGAEASSKYALIIQMPLNASDFSGTWHRGDFVFNPFEISDGLLQVPVDKNRSLLAEPGQQLLVIDGDFSEIPFGPVQLWMDFSPNQAAPLLFKVLQAAVVKIGDERFYPPILPCTTDMAEAIALSMSASDSAVIPVSFLTPEGCDGDMFMYFQNSKDFRVQGCMSGSWSDALFNGQGFLVEILDVGLALVYWFTFDDNGVPVWMFGVGEVDGTKIIVTMLYDTGGPIFGPGWDVADFVPFEWGTLTLEFTRYNRGTASFVSLFPGMFPSHPMDLRRATSLWGPPCQPSDLELASN